MGLFGGDDSRPQEFSEMDVGEIGDEDVRGAIDDLPMQSATEALETSKKLSEVAGRHPEVVHGQIDAMVAIVRTSLGENTSGLGANQSLVWSNLLDVVDAVVTASGEPPVDDGELAAALILFLDHENDSLQRRALRLLVDEVRLSDIEAEVADAVSEPFDIDQLGPLVKLAAEDRDAAANSVLAIVEQAVVDEPGRFTHQIDDLLEVAVDENIEVSRWALGLLDLIVSADPRTPADCVEEAGIADHPGLHSDQIDVLVEIALEDDIEVARWALGLLVPVASADPGSLTDHTEELVIIADQAVADLAVPALEILEAVATTDGDAVAEHLDVLIEVARTEEREVATAAISVLEAVTTTDGDAVAEHLDALIEVARTEERDLSMAAISVLEEVASTDTALFEDRLDGILDVVVARDGQVAVRAGGLLATVVQEAPEAMVDHVDALRAVELPEEAPRKAIRREISVIAEDHAESVAPLTGTIVQGLDTDDEDLLEVETRALLSIATTSPTAVEPHLDTLQELLDHESSSVKKNVCEVFGYAGDEQYVDAIRDLRQSDEQDVRVTAETTIQRMEQTTMQAETLAASEVGGGSSTDLVAGDALEAADTLSDLASDASEFDTIERIGSGGNGVVSKCEAPDGTVVAVKQPRFEGETLDSDAIDRFVDEALTWAKLDDHEYIVTVHDIGREPLPWIAMEYVNAGNLHEHVGTLEFEEKTNLAAGIADSVRHAHRRGIAHLDLKPANILVADDDGVPAPKVTDWGLAKMLIDHSQSIEGYTPQYAAPEQFDPDTYGPPDDYTDIYQLGTLLYELYTGELPFDGPPAQMMHAVLYEDPSAPTSVDPSLPADLDDVLLSALAKEKDQRYETLVNLRNDLRALVE